MIHLGPSEGDAFSAMGDVYRVLASGRQTGDVYALSEIRVSPNNGPPPHIHSREDECFLFWKARSTLRLVMKRSKPGLAHSFTDREALHTVLKTTRNCRARILGFVTPAGFENFFKEFARPIASFDSPAMPLTKDEVDKLLIAAPKHGLQILPPNR